MMSSTRLRNSGRKCCRSSASTASRACSQSAGDASILGVVFEDDPASVRKFVADRGVDWPMVMDPSGKIALDFGVRGPPESFLIDPNGVVLVKFIGEVKAAQLDALVRQAEQARA